MVLSLLAQILFSMALCHLCRVFGLGTSPEGAGTGKGKRFLQGLQQRDLAGLSEARAAPCPTAPLPSLGVRLVKISLSWVRRGCSRLLSHLHGW